MLKKRLLTAALLIPLVVLSILFLPTDLIQWLMVLVIMLAAWEWFSIIGFDAQNKKLFSILVLIFVSVLLSLLSITMLMSLALVVWGVMLVFISVYAHKPLPPFAHKLLLQANIALVIAAFMLALFGLSAIELHSSTSEGAQQLLYVVVLVWLADTGGYFAGKKWGKTALAKAISPNKTWQGVAGALVLGICWALIGFYLNISGDLSLFAWLSLSIVTSLISVVGDLFESLFKRCYQVKDSGNLLPGHGGILDRIDSLISAVPVFSAGLYFLGAW